MYTIPVSYASFTPVLVDYCFFVAPKVQGRVISADSVN